MKIKSIYNPIFTETAILFGTESNQIQITNLTPEVKENIKLLINGVSETDLNKTDLKELIDTLNEYGLIENEKLEEQQLDDEKKIRYKTNLNYFKNYSTITRTAASIQKELNQKKILLLGVGGDSILATALIGMGIENLILVDYDKIELSNLNRQFIFTEDSLGKLKTEEAKGYLSRLNTKCNIETHNIKIQGTDDIDELIKKSDIIINAIDTPPIECNRWVNYCCVKYKKPLFQMGMGNSTVFIEKYLFQQGCYDCTLLEQFKEDFVECNCALKEIYSPNYKTINTSFAPNILVGSGLLAMEIFKYLICDDVDDISFEFDLNTYQIKFINPHKKSLVCPTCNANKKYVPIENIVEIAKRLYGNKQNDNY